VSAVRQDLVHEALLALEEILKSGDALAAELATDKVLQLLAFSTEPASDPRLLPIFARCQVLANALKASLQDQLRESATSHRAEMAYEREVGEIP
jgi:hypothetical protein